MITLAEYPINEIVSKIDQHGSQLKFEVNGQVHKANIHHLRLQCFKRSTKCSVCGIEGNVFRLEKYKPSENPHLNLYHVSNGKYILMTKCRVNMKEQLSIDNIVTMCHHCQNKRK